MTNHQISDRPPSLADAQIAARRFLEEALPDAQRVDVTRVARLEPGDGGWEAEAVVWRPNATIEALGLPVLRPVLDRIPYIVRLSARLDVTEYLLREGEGE